MANMRPNSGKLNLNNGAAYGKYSPETSIEHVVSGKTHVNSSHPDFMGKIDVDGKEYYVSGWYVKGYDFISLAINKPYTPDVTPPQPNQPQRKEGSRVMYSYGRAA